MLTTFKIAFSSIIFLCIIQLSLGFEIKSKDWGSRYLSPISLGTECTYGGNVSPDLTITKPFDKNIKSLVILIQNKNIEKDPNIYWFVTGIPVSNQHFKSGDSIFNKDPFKVLPNSWDMKGYLGPCPLPSADLQFYVLHVYALDRKIPNKLVQNYATDEQTRKTMFQYIQQHAIDSKTITSAYSQRDSSPYIDEGGYIN